MANKHMKILNITHHEGNTTQDQMIYFLTPVRMDRIKKTKSNKCWQRWGRKETLTHHWWECKLEQLL
jgi:hypothetical protein